MMSRYIISIALLLALVFPGSAFCEEGSPAAAGMEGAMLAWANDYGEQWKIADETAANPNGAWYATSFIPAQHLTLRPVVSVRMGYRFVGLEDSSRRAAQYDYLHSSFAGRLDFHYYPLPFMFDADFNYRNIYDHDGNVRIAYSDMVRLDYRNMALFHNLDHWRLIAAVPGSDIQPDDEYGVEVTDNELKLVLKSPQRPYHLYVGLRRFEKGGTIQQRWDDDEFTNNTLSQSRDIDWVTSELTAGINGNVLGLFELDYHHTLKVFDSELRSTLVDTYLEPAGAILEHNLVYDTETNEDVISIHTDQSKPLVAAGTFSWGDKVNKHSDARVDFHREAGDLSYKALDNLFLALKYGHQVLDVTNPETVTQKDFSLAPALWSMYDVENRSISTKRDRAVASVLYYPLSMLGILAEYKLDRVERTNAKSWSHIDDVLVTKACSITHTGKLSATLRPERHTKLRASVSYSHNGDPSYIPDYSSVLEGCVTGTWVPTPGLTVNAQYKLLRGKNPARTEASNGNPEFDERRRSVEKDNAGAGVTWLALDGLVVGANYDYMRMKIVTNIILGSTGMNKYTPYWDTSHSYTLFGNYCFSFPLSVEASFGQTWTRGMFRLYDIGLPADYANLSDQKTRETRGTVKADYEIWRGWGACLSYMVSNFRDQAIVDNPVTGYRNGTAHAGTALLTKVW